MLLFYTVEQAVVNPAGLPRLQPAWERSLAKLLADDWLDDSVCISDNCAWSAARKLNPRRACDMSLSLPRVQVVNSCIKEIVIRANRQNPGRLFDSVDSTLIPTLGGKRPAVRTEQTKVCYPHCQCVRNVLILTSTACNNAEAKPRRYVTGSHVLQCSLDAGSSPKSQSTQQLRFLTLSLLRLGGGKLAHGTRNNTRCRLGRRR